jgi:hypothetical protein
MQGSQQVNKSKIFCRASLRQRLLAGIVFLITAASLGLLRLAATGRIDIGRWINPCGMKQRWGLPCPTCGMTTSALAFVRGEILQSFYIQPAAALLCSVIVTAAFLALVTMVFGVYFHFLVRIKAKYVILALLVIIALGWMITLARELAKSK